MPTEIICNLWFGNEFDLNSNFLKEKNINCLILCNKFLKINNNYKDDKLIVPIENHINNNDISEGEIINIIIDLIKFINERLINGEKILIICKTGIQCSPMIIVMYLKKYAKITSNLSIKYVLSKNINVFKGKIQYLSLINRLNKI